MHKILMMGVILLSGCAAMTHDHPQPVRQISANTYMTTCGGAVEDWNTCYDKAYKTCDGKYTVISKEDNSHGTKRVVNFECKK